MTKRNSTGASASNQVKKKDPRSLTTEQFIANCIKTHGDKYDYSEVEYIRQTEKVRIFCKRCDDYFEQSAGIHMRGSNCQRCVAKNKTKSNSDFIKQAKAVHGSRYDYSKTKYKNKRTKVVITCKTHGDFEQRPQTHLSGSGCYHCGVERQRLTSREFITKSIARHGDLYEYDSVEYTTNFNAVKIHCKHHGLFEQMPSDHLKGHGCPECNKGRLGYGRTEFERLCEKNNNGQGIFYLIRCQSHKESFYKIGITSRSIHKRFSRSEDMPYDYEVLSELTASPDFVFDLENRIKSTLSKLSYEPLLGFKGYTECFSDIPKPVKKLISSIEKDNQLQLIV